MCVSVFSASGGLCYPSDHDGTDVDDCAYRATTPLGSSTVSWSPHPLFALAMLFLLSVNLFLSPQTYPPSIPNTGYEGGKGFLSGITLLCRGINSWLAFHPYFRFGPWLTAGNSNLTAFANFSVAYLKYCDVWALCQCNSFFLCLVKDTDIANQLQGGSFSGNREDTPTGSKGKPVYYRGLRNLNAIIDHLLVNKGMQQAKEVVISGCSAGGIACYMHCDALADRLAPIPVKCICDAGKRRSGGFGWKRLAGSRLLGLFLIGLHPFCDLQKGIFLDVPNVTGQQAMRAYLLDVVEGMNSTGEDER